MYVDLAGLARYKSDFGAWARGRLLPKDAAAARVRTAKAGAVSFVPVQRTPLDVSVDFLFTEVPPASGDKGPDNPSTITGVSEVKVTRCGKNLCPLIGESSSSYISVSFTDNGEFVFNGSYIGLVDVYVFNKTYNINLFPIYLERGKTYTFSLQGDNSSVSFQVYVYQTNNYGGAVVSIAPGESQTYTIPNTQSMILRFSIPANTVLNNAKFKLQIEEGSTATAFEPYTSTDYTLPLGSTYYGGTLDVASGVMTVTVGATILDENYNFGTTSGYLTEYSGFYAIVFYPGFGPYRTGYNIPPSYTSNRLPIEYKDSSGVPTQNSLLLGSNSRGMKLCLSKSDLSLGDGATIAAVRTAMLQWLSTHPVTITCPLETPTTVQLTPAQILSLSQPDKYVPRLNTVYSDASAVQAGYLKNPSAASSELRNALVSLGGGI